MALPSGYRLVTPGPTRIDDFIAVDAWAFMFEPREIDHTALRRQWPAARARAVEIADGSRGPVGTYAAVYTAYTFGMRVPGGAELPTAGLSWVGVHPGHRRRGLLSAMIDDHFAVSLGAGHAVSALYAMEAPIYGRFGYASAAPRLRLQVGELADVPGSADLPVRFERVDVAAHSPVVRAVHERMTRPGTIVEPDEGMLAELLADLPSDLEDRERSALAIVNDAEGPAAYARFTRTLSFEAPTPSAKLVVEVSSSATVQAQRRLFATLKELDLVEEVSVRGVAPDDPLITLAKDIRSLKAMLLDALWVRILDLPAALAARSYAADVDVVIEVSDERVPANAGTWRLRVAGSNAALERTDAAADVTLSIADLSGAYLGGDYLRKAALAGTISEHTPGTVRALTAAMRTDEEPFGNMWF